MAHVEEPGFTVDLTPEQVAAVRKGKPLTLSVAQVKTLRGKLSASMRTGLTGTGNVGRRATCECGTCPKCTHREYVRQWRNR